MPPSSPAITVVLIVHNDAVNVVAAATSAMVQTFHDLEIIIVDDGSTDATPEVVDAIARADERLRVLHLSPNSGGCGAPRNAGIDAARGAWVTFLDSDDLFEPDACAVLYEAARRHDADVVSGAMLRIDLVSGRASKRFGWLYEREAVFAGLRECPELLSDVMVQNKIFRRSLLDEHELRFPLGVHYEDMDFTARALAKAARVAVVTDVVYRYMQRPADDHPSISQRTDVQGFRDRITVHRMMDEFLLGEQLPAAKLVKDVKFLQHDVRMHLQNIDREDADVRSALVNMAREYIVDLDQAAIRRLRPVQRALIALVRRGDVATVVCAMRVRRCASRLARRGVESIPSPIAERLRHPRGVRRPHGRTVL